jgi:tetratricopeptide (TPR) repeat protein
MPAESSSSSTPPTPVVVRREQIVLPTYEPQAPDRNPMFLERRVYQGSSGRVYPLPFIDRIAETPKPRAWEGVWIENDFLRVLILPQLGGRIHRAVDKTNGYDLIYYQPVIKPGLVGLAGPWVSGGIEFNWPQHHRPSTFMPTDVAIERHGDGSATVWLSEHDPMARMKGMHGVCLHPGRALIELKARAYNRTDDVQTFLWWANVATRVHEGYQSFFPPDATYVADHARRAMSTFPRCSGLYYGVDYASRARDGVPASERPRAYPPRKSCPPDDLSWYANIPVPTSYMCLGSSKDFFGGYDHKAQAGIVHVCDHHISPGKKQWTWGNHEFGYAWDRNLTDPDEHGEFAPYIEIMAGVYTDNQPDFSFLQPGETKSWSQFWYPIQQIGPTQHATTDAAVHLSTEAGRVRIGVSVTSRHAEARVTLRRNGRTIATWVQDLAPGAPLVATTRLPRGAGLHELALAVVACDGREIISYTPEPVAQQPVPPAASEPPAPAEVASTDELFLIGVHLEQYRHATRMPELYWREALQRDPGDSRCTLALGRWHLRRGEFDEAESHLRTSIARLALRNANPYDGEAYYQLGRCLRHLGRDADAYAAFAKATWSEAWASASHHALAELDCARHAWPAALDHLDRCLRLNTDNLRARDLKAIVLRKLGREAEAEALLAETLALDPLDGWARHLLDKPLTCDTQTRLDLAHDYARAGFLGQALDVLADARPEPASGTAPLLEYTRAWLADRIGDAAACRRFLRAAAKAPPDYCFPARLEEIAILRFAMDRNSADARAPYYLANLLYDRRRHREAIALWEQAVRLDPANAVAWRNLGIGRFNILRRPVAARHAYERALAAHPRDARLLYERDQLWKRLGLAPKRRLRELEKHSTLVGQRDDLSVEYCALLNQAGRSEDARCILGRRRFQPWEGGEGQALGQHVRTHVLLGRAALEAGDAAKARGHFEAALSTPENLGEARHLLANASDVHFWLGESFAALARAADTAERHPYLDSARRHWARAATFSGNFQEMSVRTFSEMTYFSALAWRRLGEERKAHRLLCDLLAYAHDLVRKPAVIDYFATSLPTMLLFEDNLQERQTTLALFLEAQARLGLGQQPRGLRLLREVLRRDPAHAPAADLLSATASARSCP